MIRPPAWDGVAFSEESDGDFRADLEARRDLADTLDVDHRWATVRQVHGNTVREVDGHGDAGESDALWTATPGLPIAVFTADCFGVVLHSQDAVGVAHAGWRGAASSVVEGLREAMTLAGHEPERAAIGPGIGPCCFEVGPEVADRFPGNVHRTTWGTTSVDLVGVIVDQLHGIQTWVVGGCTLHEDGWFSHRGDATLERMVALGWLP